ncbi:MAG: PLP-dependent transferase [Actinomycetales bacterium]|nr:PLP-dependent transferase [Actinomycetales bacterium]
MTPTPAPAPSAVPSLASLAVHAGREDLTDLGVHTMPIDLSTTNPLPSIEAGRDAYDAFAAGERPAPGMTSVYRRAWNPTVARFETAIAALEAHDPGGVVHEAEGIAFATGMAAMTAVLLSRVAAGLPHVLAVRPLYGGTDALLASGLVGTEVDYVDAHEVAAAVTDRTGLVVMESPCNPTLDLRDIADVVRQAGTVPVLVDNTFATPVLQRPLTLGAGYVLHSATKYIGGHGDAMGGVVVTSPARAKELRPIRTITGGVLDPWSAYLLHRGLATLPVRVLAQQATAADLAAWLVGRAGVARVFYPGLPGADPQGLIGRQMAGPGAMVAFELAGGFASAERVCAALSLITHAVSLGGVDTLIEHPAALTHRVVAEEAQPGAGVLRVSVGLESAADLQADLDRALSHA